MFSKTPLVATGRMKRGGQLGATAVVDGGAGGDGSGTADTWAVDLAGGASIWPAGRAGPGTGGRLASPPPDAWNRTARRGARTSVAGRGSAVRSRGEGRRLPPRATGSLYKMGRTIPALRRPDEPAETLAKAGGKGAGAVGCPPSWRAGLVFPASPGPLLRVPRRALSQYLPDK